MDTRLPFHWYFSDTKWTKAVVETIDNVCWKIVFTSFIKQTTFWKELKIVISERSFTVIRGFGK